MESDNSEEKPDRLSRVEASEVLSSSLTPEQQKLFDELTAISKRAAAHLREPFKSMAQEELMDQLYDERGLPK